MENILRFLKDNDQEYQKRGQSNEFISSMVTTHDDDPA